MIDKRITHPHDLPAKKRGLPKGSDRFMILGYVAVFIVVYSALSALVNALFAR